MKIYYRIVNKNILSILSLILCLGTSYPLQDSLQSKFPATDLKLDEIVASIGSINITVEEFYNSYEFGPAFVKRQKDSKKRYLNYMINEKLLALDGYSRNLDEKKDIALIIKEFENDIATEEMFKEDILNNIKIVEEEIDTVITQKLLELDIRWLFAESEEEVKNYTDALSSGISFDSLYRIQFEDSIYLDDRSMKINRFQLGKKNTELAKIVDTLPIGHYSEPAKVFDGWYIIIINNVWRNIVTTETEMIKLRQESISCLKKKKMDILSDKYVQDMFIKQNPIIKRHSFNILRSYLGMYSLPIEKYNEWNFADILSAALDTLRLTKENIGETILVGMNNGIIKLEEFINWYKNRSQYIKFNTKELQSFSNSLESMIWSMVRDKLLSDLAYERGYHKTDSFMKQAKWWKNKIVYSAVRKEVAESVILKENEVGINELDSMNAKSINEKKDVEITRQLLLKLNELKSKYDVTINEDVLEKVPVSDQENPKAIDFYTVKKGGLIPRPAFPTIDQEWIEWE